MSASTTFQPVETRRVQFRISDVFYPNQDKILGELHGNDMLEGVVIDESEGVAKRDNFLAVRVEGLSQPVIVPVGCVREARAS